MRCAGGPVGAMGTLWDAIAAEFGIAARGGPVDSSYAIQVINKSSSLESHMSCKLRQLMLSHAEARSVIRANVIFCSLLPLNIHTCAVKRTLQIMLQPLQPILRMCMPLVHLA